MKKDLEKFRKMNIDKLKEELTKFMNEFFQKRIESGLGKKKNTSIFSANRKQIARIKTVIREKEILNEQ